MTGCAQFAAPSYSQVYTLDGVATVTCEATGEVVEMTCVGDKWHGTLIECPTGKYMLICYCHETVRNHLNLIAAHIISF